MFSDEYNLSSTYAGGRGQQENTGWNPERDWFSLNNEVGLGRKNNRSDVLKVQSILGESGHYDLERTDGPTGFMGSDFDENIKDFQRDNGLEVDGWLKPNGPTIKTMKKKLGSIFGEYPAPTPDEVEQHHVSLKSGGKPLLQHRPPVPVLQPIEDLPEIDDEDQGAIGRSVKYLLNYSDPGEHPQDTARIIRDVGDYGLAYGRELVEEIRAKDPELGNKYLLRLLENLSAQLQTIFIGGPKPKHIPLGVPRPDLFPEYSPEWEKLKRRRGEWDSDSRIPDLSTPPYVPEYAISIVPRQNFLAANSAENDGGDDAKALNSLAEFSHRQANGEFEPEEAQSKDNDASAPETPLTKQYFPDDYAEKRDWEAEIGQTLRQTDEKRISPTINLGHDRVRNIIEDKPARFDIIDKGLYDGSPPLWRKDELGKEAVDKYSAIVEKEAKAQGVDPNLVKAILYYENADGHKFGVNDFADRIGMSGSVMPMNINPKIWEGLGITRQTASDPETNIRASVTLIKRISERIDDPTPAKIGSLWNGIKLEMVNERGSRIEKIHEKRPWENLAKYYLDRKK